jgi:hypothetical protein
MKLIQFLSGIAITGILAACAADTAPVPPPATAAAGSATTSTYDQCFERAKRTASSLEAAQWQCKRETSQQ